MGIVKDNIDIIEKLYLQGESLNQLGQQYGVNSALINHHLRQRGITIRSLTESVKKCIKNREIASDNFLHENLLGWILGDGSIRLGQKNKTSYFLYTDKKLDHIHYINNILNNYEIKTNIYQHKQSSCYALQTECLSFFNTYYNIFYGYDGLNEK